MDLSHEERSRNARAVDPDEAPKRDRELIRQVMRTQPRAILRYVELGRVCPYEPTQKRQRAAWVREIHRQEEDEQLCP
jgi:CRP-like cAMP-binding protein